MLGNKTLKTHEALMNRMADTLGADLDELELRGGLPPEERSEMVNSCTACTDPTGCGHWLDETETAEHPPGYCRNGERIAELARQFCP